MKPMHRYSRRYSQVVEAFDRGRWREAFELASHVVAELPNDAEMHFLGGVAAMQLYQLPIALSFLEKAVGLRPRSARYAAQYARALVISGLMPDAIAAADAAMASAEEWDASAYDTLGVIYSKGNMHGPAAEAFRRAVALAPRNANYRFNLGTSLMYYGDIEGAEREYEACLAADPEYWRGYLALSQLRRQSAECNHVERFSRLLERAPDPDAQLHLHLALAKEHEDLGAYSTAFGHYVKGKSAYGDLMGSSATDDAKVFDAIEEYFHGWRLAAQGHDSAEPIFVVGMPRTGTTLLDRILSSHSMVRSAGELGHFAAALQRIGRARARNLAESISNLDRSFDRWADVGREYIESTRPVTGHAPHFVDKLPHNFLYAGFIALALPKAKLVCIRRNPMDTCLSNFRQLFAPESVYHRYSFNLLDTGRYYLRFDRLMRQWQRLFPARILEVSYDALVVDQEGATRELLEFCDLPWEDACMSFEANKAPVPSASAVQVRSGMNRESLERWKLYESTLGELRQLLEAGGVRIQ